MRHQATIKTALMLTVFFLAAGAVQATPVRYGDIFALASAVGQSGRPSVDLRLKSPDQQPAGSTQQTASTTNSGNSQDQRGATDAAATAGTTATTRAASLTATEVAPPQTSQQPNVETVELGEVQGTICDCGPIHIPGGFPKWPLLGLGAIPFFFIHEGCQTQPCGEIPPTPTPTPTPTSTPSVPEPATIFLFGTGLLAVGAGARRRHARNVKTENAREVSAS